MNPVVTGQFDRRITAKELAAAIRVDRGTISNWHRRNVGFPAGQTDGRVTTYSVQELLAWLDTQEIPKRQRRVTGEPDDTYGLRMRRWLAHERSEIEPRPVAEDVAMQAVAQLIESCKTYFPQHGVQKSDVLETALLLAFTWITAPREWEAIEAAGGRREAVVTAIDAVLRRFGFDHSANATLSRFRSAKGDALKMLVRHCNRLGVPGFEMIANAIADEFCRKPETYRTPREVCELMGACAVPVMGPVNSVADLYNRHGELVLAVPTSEGEKASVVHATGIDPDAARRTRMRLIVHGRAGAAQVMVGGVPWQRRLGTAVFDAVVVNPPFNRPLGPVAAEVGWKYGRPPRHNSNLAWVQAALAATSAQGRAVVLMPISEAAEIGSGSDSPRKNLVDGGALRAVIRLSGDLFPASSVDTTVWVLEHPRAKRRDQTIVFVDATGLKYKEHKRGLSRLVGMSAIAEVVRSPDSFAPGEIRKLAVEVGDRRVLGRAVAVPASEVAAQGYALTPDTYLGPAVDKGEAYLRQIQADAVAVAQSRTKVLESPSGPISAVLRALDPTGMAPGWRAVRLREICDVKSGPSGLKRSAIVTGDDGVVPVLRPPNLTPRRIDAEVVDRTSKAVAEQFATHQVDPDDILLVRVGSVGRAAIVRSDHRGYLIDSNLIRLRLDPDVVLPRFLLEFLQRTTTIDRIRAIATGGVAPSVSGRQLGRFDIALPPLEEQAAIVEILAEHEHRVTALREALRAEEKLRGSLAEGLMSGSVGLVDRVR